MGLARKLLPRLPFPRLAPYYLQLSDRLQPQGSKRRETSGIVWPKEEFPWVSQEGLYGVIPVTPAVPRGQRLCKNGIVAFREIPGCPLRMKNILNAPSWRIGEDCVTLKEIVLLQEGKRMKPGFL